MASTKTKNKFVLSKSDDENLTVFLNGKEIASANHDTDGWAGMEAIEELVTKIAKALKIPVERGTYDSEENEYTADE